LQISVPSAGIELTVEPWIEAQEMRVAFTYWEGAVRISGTSGGVAVSGNGYVEMTGYKGSMQGVF
jgi:predicted secreted hydrolase